MTSCHQWMDMIKRHSMPCWHVQREVSTRGSHWLVKCSLTSHDMIQWYLISNVLLWYFCYCYRASPATLAKQSIILVMSVCVSVKAWKLLIRYWSSLVCMHVHNCEPRSGWIMVSFDLHSCFHIVLVFYQWHQIKQCTSFVFPIEHMIYLFN